MPTSMSERKFAALCLLAVCGTIAGVAAQHRLGLWQSLLYVGAGAASVLTFESTRLFAARVIPHANALDHINFASVLLVAPAGLALAAFGVAQSDRAALAAGVFGAVLSGAVGYRIFRRARR